MHYQAVAVEGYVWHNCAVLAQSKQGINCSNKIMVKKRTELKTAEMSKKGYVTSESKLKSNILFLSQKDKVHC